MDSQLLPEASLSDFVGMRADKLPLPALAIIATALRGVARPRP